jgi:DegV family protein with EDD domain
MPVKVVTDSTAALAPGLAAAHGIAVVPCRVVIGGVGYPDDAVSLRELLDRFDEGVSTAGPIPADFGDVLAGAGDGAVVVTVAGNLSSSFKSAGVAASLVASGGVRVVDSGTAAGAQALAVLHAARVAAGGASLDEVEAAARLVLEQVRLYGVLETFEYLVRGGRLNSVVGKVAAGLRVHPVFELRRGNIVSMAPCFSQDRAIKRLLGYWRRSRVQGARLHVVALHALAEENARRLLEAVRREVEPTTGLVSEFGPVMVVHTGPGLLGLAWWWEEG